MKAITVSKLPATPETVWRLLNRSDTLCYVARGVVSFSAANDFPEQWYLGYTARTTLRVLGVTSIENYSIQFVSINKEQFEIHTKEGGGDLKQWDHLMKIIPDSDTDTCWYRDEVEVEAGSRTWLVWLFAKLFYRYRHLRWRLLLKNQVDT